MATAPKWKEKTIDAAGIKLHVSRAGKGAPLVVLHHDFGTPDRLPIYDKLAETYDVIVPHHAGWGKSTRPEWMRSVRDMAVLHQGVLADQGIVNPTLLGLGFGGWIAAEMATMAPKAIDKLVLVAPFGIKPDEGYILDQAIISYIDYPQAAFHDQTAFTSVYGNVSTDQLEAWDIAREMSFRIAWKPYMYSPTLPYLLGAVKTPTLIVWGAEDKHIPLSTANQWLKAMPKAKLQTIKGCGHAVEMEKPEELAKLVTKFVG
jgi:pimeloyl-ACP methyl ester carboxylesterase